MAASRIVIAMVVLARIAHAQPAESEADRLFKAGLALYDQQKYDEACTKFEQSIARDPRAIGTLMNLGRCNERRGKIATALKLFQEAYDRATESNAPVMRDTAQARIAALSAQVPVLTFKRAAAPLPGEKLVIDDAVIALDAREVLVDPGPHTVVLTAPGRLPHEVTVRVEPASKRVVQLPALQVPKNKTVVTQVRTSPRRLIGKIATFSGGGVTIASVALGLYAKRDYDKQFDDPDGDGPRQARCGASPAIDGKPACDAAGQSRVQRDRNIGTLATVTGIVGLVATGAGIMLWLSAPDDERATLAPTVSATGAGISLSGRF